MFLDRRRMPYRVEAGSLPREAGVRGSLPFTNYRHGGVYAVSPFLKDNTMRCPKRPTTAAITVSIPDTGPNEMVSFPQ